MKQNNFFSNFAPFLLALLISVSYSYFTFASPNNKLKSLNDTLDNINQQINSVISKTDNKEVGEKGNAGTNGKDGTNGSVGLKGAEGIIGLRGATGQTGLRGFSGLAGATGATGSSGVQGAKGDTGPTGPAGDTTTIGSVTTQVTTYYVSPTGSDSTGTGTVGNPYATIQFAVDTLPNFIAHTCTIQLAPGTYRESIILNKNNINGTPYFYILGNTAAPDSYRITGADASADTTAVRDYGIQFFGDANYSVSGLKFDYYRKAGFYTQSYNRISTGNINFSFCAQDNLYGAVRLGTFSYIRIIAAINIIGNGGDNESGFYSGDGQSSMYNLGTFTISIKNVKYGIYTATQSQWITDEQSTWVVDNSEIAKIAGSAAFYFLAADHSHNFNNVTIKNFTYGLYLDNMSLFDIDTVIYTTVDTNVFTANGSVAV